MLASTYPLLNLSGQCTCLSGSWPGFGSSLSSSETSPEPRHERLLKGTVGVARDLLASTRRGTLRSEETATGRGKKITSNTHSAFEKPLVSWVRKMSPKTTMRSQIQATNPKTSALSRKVQERIR